MKKLLLVSFSRSLSIALCLLLIPFVSPAQTFGWAKDFGGSVGTAEGDDIARDANGNLYVVGDFNGTVDFDPGAGTSNLSGNADIYLCKLDANGDFVWVRSFGLSSIEYAHGIAVDAAGDVYITGAFTGLVDADPGPAIHYLSSNGNTDFFIIKMSAAGNFLWGHSFGAAGHDYGYGLTTDATGNLLVTGTYTGTMDVDPGAGTFNLSLNGGSSDGFLFSLDPNGNFGWAINFGGADNEGGHCIARDNSGNIYVGGTEWQGDVFAARFTSAGSLTWRASCGNTTNGGHTLGITVDNLGRVFCTGQFSGTVDFDPGAGVYNLAADGYDAFAWMLYSNGTFGWAYRLAGATSQFDYGRDIALDNANNVYVVGEYDGTVDFDPGAGVFNLTPTNYGGFIWKLTSGGFFSWAVQVTGTNTNNNIVRGIVTTSQYDVITTGLFSATADFDPGAGVSNLVNNGGTDAFVWKLTQCVTPVMNATAATFTTICAGSSTTLSITGQLNSATNWHWYTGGCNGTLVGTGASIVVSPLVTTTYYVRGEGGCITSGPCSSLSITVNPAPNVTASADTTAVCPGGQVTLTGSGGNSYSWSGGVSDGVPFTPASTTSYTVTGTGPNNCTDTGVVNITVHALPNVVANANPPSVCIGGSLTLTGSGASTFSWSGSVTDGASFVPVSTDTYIVTGTDSNGCVNGDTVTVAVNGLPTVFANTSDTLVCAGSTVTLTGSGASTYNWSGGATNGVPFPVAAATTFTVTGTDVNGCTDTDSVSVAVLALPAVTLTLGLDTQCTSISSVQLTGNSPAGGVFSGTAVSGTSFDPSAAGPGVFEITYTYTDSNGCAASAGDSIYVDICAALNNAATTANSFTVYPNPVAGMLTVDAGSETLHNVRILSPTGKEVFNGCFNSSTAMIDLSGLAPGVYFLRIETSQNVLVKPVIKVD